LVSECDERKNNLVDGTNSEWWRENEAAWLEVVSKSWFKEKFSTAANHHSYDHSLVFPILNPLSCGIRSI
jgi:hypothetical protein